jgi:hypothetical protein
MSFSIRWEIFGYVARLAESLSRHQRDECLDETRQCVPEGTVIHRQVKLR